VNLRAGPRVAFTVRVHRFADTADRHGRSPREFKSHPRHHLEGPESLSFRAFGVLSNLALLPGAPTGVVARLRVTWSRFG